MMPKSRKKEKFQFLKQILEDSSASDTESDGKKNATETSTKSDGSVQTEHEKKGKDFAEPVGKYPVLFKKTCKNKGCQTRLSSFPLFPLPEETEWISDEEGEGKKKPQGVKKKKKQSKSREPNNESYMKQENETQKLSKVRNSDGTRKNFRSEHQLKETDNPVLQAWLHKKAIVGRKQRKLERQEKRAKRAALEEEARIQAERAIESIESVGQWFKRKRKQAKLQWKKSCTRVSPHQVDGSLQQGDSSPLPPPEYRVVKSFKCSKSLSDSVPGNASEDKNKSETKSVPATKQPSSSVSPTDNITDKLSSKHKTNLDMTGESNNLGNTANHVKCRPKTAVDRTENMSTSRPKTALKRPKTARERPQKNANAKPKTSSTVCSDNSPKKMQSLSYDEWLKVKRNGDKERMIKKKQDLIDSHLEAVIKELGKKRVEKIMSPRKQVDTGLKSFSRSPERPTHPDNSKANKTNPYRWVLSKKTRPEPQGCDCPESRGADAANVTCQQHVKDGGDANDAHGMVQSSEQPKLQICQEVNDKYDELKPSIEKVKDILDSEIKKLKESGKGLVTNVGKASQPTLNSSDLSSAKPDDSSIKELEPSRPMSARPSTARPTSARPLTARPGSAYLTKEQAKKVASDLDVLGLCDSTSEPEEEIEADTAVIDVENDAKSTVRENYFDYGSDVDPPTTEPAEFVQ